MAESGGSSPNAGVEYQAWVLAEIFLEIIFDKTIKVQAEGALDLNGKLIYIDDIIKYEKDKTTYYNCKYQATGASNWRISQLKNQKVLDQLYNQFKETPTQELAFITESPCPIFQEGFSRVKYSNSIKEAKKRLTTYLNDWNEVKDYLKISEEEMFQFCKQIKYERKEIQGIKNTIQRDLLKHFNNPQSIPDILKTYANEIATKRATVSQTQIIELLKKKGCYTKSIQSVDVILGTFSRVSSYLINQVSTIGNSIHIEKEELSSILSWVEKPSSENKVCAIIGKMGIGKTVLMKDLYLKLQNENIPCLALKADLYTHIKSRTEFNEEIALSEDILNSIATIIDEKKLFVLLIDQLDALSNSISNDRAAMNIFINIISSILDILNVKIVLSVRDFDLGNDPTLKNIVISQKIEINPLSRDKTIEIIKKIGFTEISLNENQLKLFQIPLHLRILSDIFNPDLSFNSFETIQDLYKKLWEEKFLSGENTKSKLDAIRLLTSRMDEQKELTAPESILDDFIEAKKELFSNGILVSTGKSSCGFFHQSFFDYSFARRFSTENISLSTKILSEHQGLFVRSQIKQTIQYLRGSDSKRYIAEIKSFFESDNLRFHIKDLLISFLGNQDNPNKDEIFLVKQYFRENLEFKNQFFKNVNSAFWFDVLKDEFIIPELKKEANFPSLESYLFKISNLRTDEIISIFENILSINKKNFLFSNFFPRLGNWTDKALNIFVQKKNKFNLSNEYIIYIIERIFKQRELDGINCFFIEIDKIIQNSKEANWVDEAEEDNIEDYKTNKNKKFEIDFKFAHYSLFKEMIQAKPDFMILEFTKRLNEIVNLTKYENYENFYEDRFLTGFELKTDLREKWEIVTIYLNELFEQIKNNNQSLIEQVVNILYPTKSISLARILCWIYLQLPEIFLANSFELLKTPEALFEIGSIFNKGIDARCLMNKIYPYYSEKQKEEIESNILNYQPKWEYRKNLGYNKFIAISSIPKELRSDKCQKIFLELERKFGSIDVLHTKEIASRKIGFPPSGRNDQKMSLKHWLNSFYKYNQNSSFRNSVADFLKAGVFENAIAFQQAIKKDPDFFYEFVLDLKDKNISLHYIDYAISGFAESNYDSQKLKKLILKFSNIQGIESSIIRAIESLDKREPIDSSLLDILIQLALNHHDPEEDRNTNDALSDGINTIRGSATFAIVIHSFRTTNPEKVLEVLEKIAEDNSVSVRACLIGNLNGMLQFDKIRTFKIFEKALRDSHPELLKNSNHFIWYCLYKEDNFSDMIPYLEKMVTIQNPNVSNQVGKVSLIAYIFNLKNSEVFIKQALGFDKNVICGIAIACLENIPNEIYREKCERVLNEILLNQIELIDEEVTRYFYGADIKDFHLFYQFLLKLSPHINYKKGIRNIAKYISKSVPDFPKECFEIAKNILLQKNNEAMYSYELSNLITVVNQSYMKLETFQEKENAMDVIDELYKKNHATVKDFIEKLDR